MAPILQSLGRTVIAGLVILFLLVLIASNVSGAGPVMGHAWVVPTPAPPAMATRKITRTTLAATVRPRD